jgi:hypothetical protein
MFKISKIKLPISFFIGGVACNEDQSFVCKFSLSWSWSYSSWIYNYLCNQYLSPPVSDLCYYKYTIKNVQDLKNQIAYFIFYWWVTVLTPLSRRFQLYRGSHFIGGWNRNTRRKPSTCRKSLTGGDRYPPLR